jgi:hypothetical protein
VPHRDEPCRLPHALRRRPPGPPVAGGPAPIQDPSVDGDEPPPVAARPQGEPQDPVSKDPTLRPFERLTEAVQLRAIRADDELADARSRSAMPLGVQLGESLVLVIMGVQHDVDAVTE